MGGILLGHVRTSIWKGAPTLVSQVEVIAGNGDANWRRIRAEKQLREQEEESLASVVC